MEHTARKTDASSPRFADEREGAKTPTENEERLRLAMEALEAGIWELDVASGQCYVSPRCSHMLGYEPGCLQYRFDEWAKMVHPEDLESARRTSEDFLDGRTSSLMAELRLKTKAKRWRWFLCQGKAAQRDASGRALKLVGTLVDISERKTMEHLLRMEHDLLNLITTTSPVGILFFGPDGKIAFVNPQAAKIMGRPPKEMLRRGFESQIWQLSPQSGKPLAEEELLAEEGLPLREALKAGRNVSACFAIRRPDGGRALLLINTAPYFDPDGQVGGTVVILEDVTEQKQHEQVLAERDHLLQETQRIAQLGSYVLDLANDRWSCSDKLLEILGIDESYPLNLLGHFDIVTQEYRKEFIDRYLDSVMNGSRFEMEYKIRRHRDGAERWVAEHCEMNHDGAGKVSRMIGTVQDVTERKAAEEAIRKLNDELDHRVMERTSQLAAAKKEIESFSYSVSHDLRAPLRHINSYSHLLIEEHGSELAPEAHFYLDRIRAASSRMGKLIDDLLTLTRFGQTNMKGERFDISILAADVANILQETQKGCTATFRVQPGLEADGDASLVRLVLENLLGNSLKYAGNKATAVIEFGQTTVDGRPAFFVRDDGVGFNMEYAGSLFQPFQRLHGAEFEGTGIGLATVKRIVELHGGSVWAEGKEEQGATFFFTLSPGPS